MDSINKGVISYLSDKGFGFIKNPQAPSGTKDVFFHASALRGDAEFNSLQVNDKVEYSDLAKDSKGTSAQRVKLDLE